MQYLQYMYRSTADAITGDIAAATTVFIDVVDAYDAVAVAIVVVATVANATGGRVCLCAHVCVGVRIYR
jgi:hypothetical protein